MSHTQFRYSSLRTHYTAPTSHMSLSSQYSKHLFANQSRITQYRALHLTHRVLSTLITWIRWRTMKYQRKVAVMEVAKTVLTLRFTMHAIPVKVMWVDISNTLIARRVFKFQRLIIPRTIKVKMMQCILPRTLCVMKSKIARKLLHRMKTSRWAKRTRMKTQ